MAKWVDNISVDLKNKMWRCGLDSTVSEQGVEVGFCEHDNELSDSTKGRNFLTGWATVRFSKRTLFLGVSYLNIHYHHFRCHVIHTDCLSKFEMILIV